MSIEQNPLNNLISSWEIANNKTNSNPSRILFCERQGKLGFEKKGGIRNFFNRLTHKNQYKFEANAEKFKTIADQYFTDNAKAFDATFLDRCKKFLNNYNAFVTKVMQKKLSPGWFANKILGKKKLSTEEIKDKTAKYLLNFEIEHTGSSPPQVNTHIISNSFATDKEIVVTSESELQQLVDDSFPLCESLTIHEKLGKAHKVTNYIFKKISINFPNLKILNMSNQQLPLFEECCFNKLEKAIFHNCSTIPPEQMKLLSQQCGNTLKELDVSHATLEYLQLEECAFNKLEKLNLSKCTIGHQKDFLTTLSNKYGKTLKEIDLLHIRGHVISFKDCKFEKLEKIVFPETAVTSTTDLKLISDQYGSTLKNISIQANNIEDCSFKTLEQVTLNGSKLNNEKLQALSKQCPDTLTELTLEGTNINTFKGCEWRNLKKIELCDTPISDGGLQELSKISGNTLEDLSISGHKTISFAGTAFKRLKALDLEYSITKEDLVTLSTQCKDTLEKLCIFSDQNMNFDSCTFPKLTELALGGVSMTDKCIKPLISQIEPGLKKIEFYNALITNESMIHISDKCGETLEELTLENTQVPSFKDCSFKSLKKITFYGQGEPSLSTSILQELLNQCGPTLKELNLGIMRLDDIKKLEKLTPGTKITYKPTYSGNVTYVVP